MQRFHEIVQRYPDIRAPERRRRDFEEIYELFAHEKAAEQASRCLQCGIPFCSVHCPLSNNIPDWLRLTAEGRLREAYETAAATNTFPEICGRICPQDRLCEGSCVVEKDFGSITIGAVEKYLTETAWEQGWIQPFPPARERAASVGIVGSGPAGLAAAEILRRAGYGVTVYDRHDRVGGLMIYGIPNFKLDKYVVLRRRDQYEASGVVFRTQADVGGALPFASLRAQHDAILIATGVYKARELDGLPGADLPGVVPALDYLIAANRHGLADRVRRFDSGELNAKGKRVIVIGGGDTAMDCVRTAVRQGARSVACLYRRDRENMPGSRREVRYAEEEGVTFAFLAAPVAFRGKGRIQEARIARMRLGDADAGGRRAPLPVENSEYGVDADLVIAALGFDAEDLPTLFGAPELALSRQGTVRVDRNMMTSLPGVFAAGDIVRGASLVVWAIADGRAAAAHMLSYLQTKAAAA